MEKFHVNKRDTEKEPKKTKKNPVKLGQRVQTTDKDGVLVWNLGSHQQQNQQQQG